MCWLPVIDQHPSSSRTVPVASHITWRLSTSGHTFERLRVAAISFLNPAPLLWNFEHGPAAETLRTRYDVRYTLPAQCAAQLASGEADLGLIPIAALPSLQEVRAVPGCVIASQHAVRSIQLVLRPGLALADVRTVAADAASRSSIAYIRVLLERFYGVRPVQQEMPADLGPMLRHNDAALLIGDPALLALEARDVDGTFADCTWVDVATLWRQHTGLPWVAAVWAVHPRSLERCGLPADALTADLCASRDAGLLHTEDLVREWAPRISLPEQTVRNYLTKNIHYTLDDNCLRAIDTLYSLAEAAGALPPYRLRLL